MRGLSVESRFGDRVELMASDHEWRPDSWLHRSTTTPSHQRVSRTEAELDLEHQNLSLLLKVFPDMSLHSIAEAYTRADGDPNYAAELLALGSLSFPFPDVGQRTDRHAVQDKFSEDGKFFEPSHKPLETSFHFDKTSEQLDEVEKQNVGSVVPQKTPGVHNHSGRPPEVNSFVQWETPESVCQSACQTGVTNGSSAGCHGRNGIKETSNSSAKGSVVGIAAGNCASNGTGNTFSCSGSSLLPGWNRFSHGNKVSAISGTVSCHRQRRSGFSHHDAGKDSKDCREGDELFFYGKQKKKKKKKGGISSNEDTGNPTDAFKKQEAAEEFLHSMLGDGLELGLDVVRDVLEHFSGDINKALETLLHMASTSPGFHVNEFSDQVSEPSQNMVQGFPNKDLAGALISFQESDEDLVQAANTLLQKEVVARITPLSTDTSELFNFDHILSKLHESFPSVDLSCLSEVLRASDLSYGGGGLRVFYRDAAQALKEAGMTPVKERGPSRVDPAEVLQALFKKEPPDNAMDAGPSLEQHNTSGELYTVVAARARARSCVSDSKPVRAKVDEYEKHRGSANDHWSTMKRYFQEAAAAHSRGERALAGVLSDKGQLFRGLAREASSRASENIFNVKNRDIENNITIDLHAQHVREACRLLKLHLRSLSSISSVHTLTIITGHGSHSVSGRAKIKPALTQYLTKMHIPWVEPNAGCLIIKMSDVKAQYPASHRSSDSSSEESQ